MWENEREEDEEEERRQEGDLITVGSQGIKTQIRETYVIAALSHKHRQSCVL